jgi:hypothetical protein
MPCGFDARASDKLMLLECYSFHFLVPSILVADVADVDFSTTTLVTCNPDLESMYSIIAAA